MSVRHSADHGLRLQQQTNPAIHPSTHTYTRYEQTSEHSRILIEQEEVQRAQGVVSGVLPQSRALIWTSTYDDTSLGSDPVLWFMKLAVSYFNQEVQSFLFPIKKIPPDCHHYLESLSAGPTTHLTCTLGILVTSFQLLHFRLLANCPRAVAKVLTMSDKILFPLSHQPRLGHYTLFTAGVCIQ